MTFFLKLFINIISVNFNMFTAREKLSGSRKTIQNYSINKPVRFAT